MSLVDHRGREFGEGGAFAVAAIWPRCRACRKRGQEPNWLFGKFCLVSLVRSGGFFGFACGGVGLKKGSGAELVDVEKGVRSRIGCLGSSA